MVAVKNEEPALKKQDTIIRKVKGELSPLIQQEKKELLNFIKSSKKEEGDGDDLLTNLEEKDKKQFIERQNFEFVDDDDDDGDYLTDVQ